MNARLTLALVACSLAFAAHDCFAGVTVGLHIGSAHVPQKNQNNENPGFYVQADHFIGGIYRNSDRRTTVYAGYVQPLGHGFDVIAGLATGYQRRCTERKVVTGEYMKVEHTSDGMVMTTVPVYGVEEHCVGFSRGAVTPALAFTYTAPFAFVGATPRAWVIPGTGKSSTVFHVSLQWSLP